MRPSRFGRPSGPQAGQPTRESGRFARTICFTTKLIVRQLRIVRWAPLACLSFLLVSTGLAQQQERRLIDRLLRPDMNLQNNAQSKKFAANAAVVENRGRVGTFFFEQTRKQKPVIETRTANTREYRVRSLQSDPSVRSSNQNRTANLPGQVATSSSRDVHDAYDANLEVVGRSFPGERAFPEQGKSQKSPDRQNPPLTIDQVRELLNKNK